MKREPPICGAFHESSVLFTVVIIWETLENSSRLSFYFIFLLYFIEHSPPKHHRLLTMAEWHYIKLKPILVFYQQSNQQDYRRHSTVYKLQRRSTAPNSTCAVHDNCWAEWCCVGTRTGLCVVRVACACVRSAPQRDIVISVVSTTKQHNLAIAAPNQLKYQTATANSLAGDVQQASRSCGSSIWRRLRLMPTLLVSRCVDVVQSVCCAFLVRCTPLIRTILFYTTKKMRLCSKMYWRAFSKSRPISVKSSFFFFYYFLHKSFVF